MIEAFARLLTKAELNSTDENLADILWLARFLPAPPPPTEALATVRADVPAPVIPSEGEQPKTPVPQELAAAKADVPAPVISQEGEQPKTPGPKTPAPTGPAAIPSDVPVGELYPQVARPLPEATRQATPIRVPATKALPNALEIGRALRPLVRRYPSRRQSVMDEEATAERIAEGGPITPVMRPMNERWFEADVVIDGSRSMTVWHRVVREFLDLLAQHGAFADVRRWTLSLAETGAVLRSPSRIPRRPGELNDPAARRLIFVLTDGVGEAWREHGLPRVLANWARTTPVVIVQMLPERLWPRTAIGVPSAAAWSPVPGVANAAMTVERPWWNMDGAARVIPIFPITLEAASIRRWAATLMGAALTAPAITFAAGNGSATPASVPAIPDDIGLLSPEERVRRFRAMVSREACDLAVFLSAVPLTLPVIGLVQRELLPESLQVHVAEVFVGGIVERLTPEDVTCDPDQIEFDFLEGVREVLQGSLRTSEAVDVLVAISRYVEKRFGQALDFAALIADAQGMIALPQAVRPFAHIGMHVYQHFLGHVDMTRFRPQPPDYPDQDSMKAVQDETADLASHEVETKPAQHYIQSTGGAPHWHSEKPDYALALNVNAENREFYINSIGKGYTYYTGNYRYWIEAYVYTCLPEQGEQILNVGMWVRYQHDGIFEERFFYGEEIEFNYWKTELIYKYAEIGTSYSTFVDYDVKEFAFFIDVRRQTGKVLRIWQSQNGRNYTLAEVFEYTHSVPRGRGSIEYANDSSVIFDLKRACQGHMNGFKKTRESSAISPVSYVDVHGHDPGVDSQGSAKIILTRAELTPSTSVPGWYGAAFEVIAQGLRDDEQIVLNFERGWIVTSYQLSKWLGSNRRRWLFFVDNIGGGLSDFSIDLLVGEPSNLVRRHERYNIKTPYVEEWRFCVGHPNVAAEYWSLKSQEFLDEKLSQKVRLLWAELIPDSSYFGWYRGVRAFVEVENLGYSKRVFLRSENGAANASYYCSVSSGKEIWLWEYLQGQSSNMLGVLGKTPFVQFVVGYEVSSQVFLDDNGGWKYTMNWQHPHAPADW